ncbi:MAG: hypothetical protein J6N47_01170 [Lachnospiraceae bacterium]|nr:hypothetical protein [Lachnospiraceae bacterium]
MEAGKFKTNELNKEILINDEKKESFTDQNIDKVKLLGMQEYDNNHSGIEIEKGNEIEIDLTNNIIVRNDQDDMMIRDQRDELLDPIRDTYQFHALSASAKIARRRLLEKIKEKREINVELEEDEDGLRKMVNGYLNDVERKKAAKETKAKLEKFGTFKKALAKDKFLSRGEKAKMLYNYAKTFAAEVEVYKAIYCSTDINAKREREIDEYLRRYDTLMEHFENNSQDMAELSFLDDEAGLLINSSILGADADSVLERAKKRALKLDKHSARQQEEEQPHEYNLKQYDSGLPAAQAEALGRTDDWLMGLGINSPKRLPFVNRILALSARERLFVYRLVETGHLANPDISDIGMSQTTYIPDTSKISFKMYRVPFRLWEKFGKDGMMRHHWGMLETALSIVMRPDVKQAIDDFAKVAERGKSAKDDKNDISQEIEDIKDDSIKKVASSVYEAAEERDRLLDEAISAVEEYVKAQKTSDGAWIKKQQRKETAEEKKQLAIAKLDQLFGKDRVLQERQQELIYATNYTAESVGDVALEIEDNTEYAVKQAALVTSKLSMIPSLYKSEIQAMAESAKAVGQTAMIGNHNVLDLVEKANLISGAASAVSGAVGLLGSLKGFKKTVKALTNGNLSVLDRVYTGTNYLYGLGASVVTAGIGLANMHYATDTAKALVENTPGLVKDISGKISFAAKAVSVGGLAMNAADYAVQGKHLYHRHQAKKQISSLKKSEFIVRDDATYMDGIIKLDGRNKTKQVVSTTFSAVNNIGGFTALIAGPAFSLIWGGASVVLSLAGKMTEYLLSERSKERTAEEFLDLNNIEDLLGNMDEEAKHSLLNNKKKLKELKKNLMNHMAAELGFTTFRTFFKHIAGKYAEFLFRKLFYDEQDDLITEDDKNAHDVSKACVQLVKGMGLRVKFPRGTDKKSIEKIRPTAKAIAAKLGG